MCIYMHIYICKIMYICAYSYVYMYYICARYYAEHFASFTSFNPNSNFAKLVLLSSLGYR